MLSSNLTLNQSKKFYLLCSFQCSARLTPKTYPLVFIWVKVGDEITKTYIVLCPSPQIREQMRLGTYLRNEKSILGCGLWAGLWRKRFRPIMSNFWGRFFQLFVGKKKKKIENIVASALKSCIEIFFGEVFFSGEKPFFFRANLILK